jgi:hypothetical protein
LTSHPSKKKERKKKLNKKQGTENKRAAEGQGAVSAPEKGAQARS